jgi:hypothetical protein
MYPFIEKATLGKELFITLKPKFVEVGAPLEKMWELVMPKSPYISHAFGGNPETMAGLKELLNRFSEDLEQIDRLWAHDALDEALIFQQNKQSFAGPWKLALRAAKSLPPAGLDSSEVAQRPLSTKSSVASSLDGSSTSQRRVRQILRWLR